MADDHTITMTRNSIQAVVWLRTLGPSGLNPPQINVIDRLQTLSEDENGPLADLDIDIWRTSIGPTQTADRDPVGMRDTVAEFIHWADAHGYTLRPAFEWRSADSTDAQEQQIVTPLITLALYSGEHLQAVYPYVDGDDVHPIHEGVEALESIAGPEDVEQAGNEETRTVLLP